MIIAKNTSAAGSWYVGHKEISDQLKLEDNSAAGTFLTVDLTGDETTFQADNGSLNASSSSYIAYLFADTPGLIKCGKYTGTGSPVTINTGWKAGWILIKNITSSSDWYIQDTKRDPSNPSYNSLSPNSAAAEGGNTNNNSINFNSTDIQIVATGSGGANSINSSGNEYIYVAIAAPVIDTLSAEDFTEQKAKFITYENRKAVKQGEEALENRTALITGAEDELIQAQIKKLLEE